MGFHAAPQVAGSDILPECVLTRVWRCRYTLRSASQRSAAVRATNIKIMSGGTSAPTLPPPPRFPATSFRSV
jgi:hypothetical protein